MIQDVSAMRDMGLRSGALGGENKPTENQQPAFFYPYG